ncbi:MAG: peptidoglycan -binding protein [Yoonia sp.]
MALGRRNSGQMKNAIWPGFVDAMTGLLLVLMFVLTIFMVIQFVLRETITGQATQLDELAAEITTLAAALGLEQDKSLALTEATDAQAALISRLSIERDEASLALSEAQNKITGFEAQVAGLLSQRAEATAQITDLQAEQTRLMTEQEALNLALAQARTEVDKGVEEARLAAARREALEALVAEGETRISALEAERLVDGAAAEALRERLANADTELTAMTLALEARRKEAEDTLTLLAAAEAASADLDAKLAAAVLANADLTAAQNVAALDQSDLRAQLAAALAAAEAEKQGRVTQLTEAERQAALLSAANRALSDEKALSAESQRQVALLNEQTAQLRTQIGTLQALLDLAENADVQANVQIQSLGSQLNTALARVAAEERRRLALETAERERLEKETANLERFKSDFFGQLRDVLEGQDRVRIEGDRFVFSSEVLFEQGSATLSVQGRGEIANVAEILRKIAKDIPPSIDWVIRVDGHTDNVPLSGAGQFSNNWELSQARALSVVLYMVDFLGISPERLAANGFGEYQPINPANTSEARAQNRRIELKLTER